MILPSKDVYVSKQNIRCNDDFITVEYVLNNESKFNIVINKRNFGLDIEEQKRRLEKDGIVVNDYTVNLSRYGWNQLL